MTLPRLTEQDIADAYGLHREVARPCLCGALIVADANDPAPMLRARYRTTRHLVWRSWLATWADRDEAPQ